MSSMGSLALICDLDGTLANTAPSIHRAGQLMLRELELPDVGFEEAMGFIGDGLNRYVKRLLLGSMWGEPDTGLFERAVAVMRMKYSENLTWNCSLYDGVTETLEILVKRGCRLACVTNKPESYAHRLLEHFGIRGRFSVLIGGDTLECKKPDPLPVLHAMKLMDVDRSSTVFVGDGSADSKACKSAGVLFVAAEYGYNCYPIPSENFSPDIIIKSFSEVVDVMLEITHRQDFFHG